MCLPRIARAGITEMDFNSADMFVEIGQITLNQTLDMASESLAAFDVVACADFDMHAGYFQEWPCEGLGFLVEGAIPTGRLGRTMLFTYRLAVGRLCPALPAAVHGAADITDKPERG